MLEAKALACERGERIGHLPALKDELTVAENLAFAAQLAGVPASGAQLEAALDDDGIGCVRELAEYGRPHSRPIATTAVGNTGIARWSSRWPSWTIIVEIGT